MRESYNCHDYEIYINKVEDTECFAFKAGNIWCLNSSKEYGNYHGEGSCVKDREEALELISHTISAWKNDTEEYKPITESNLHVDIPQELNITKELILKLAKSGYKKNMVVAQTILVGVLPCK